MHDIGHPGYTNPVCNAADKSKYLNGEDQKPFCNLIYNQGTGICEKGEVFDSNFGLFESSEKQIEYLETIRTFFFAAVDSFRKKAGENADDETSRNKKWAEKYCQSAEVKHALIAYRILLSYFAKYDKTEDDKKKSMSLIANVVVAILMTHMHKFFQHFAGETTSLKSEYMFLEAVHLSDVIGMGETNSEFNELMQLGVHREFIQEIKKFGTATTVKNIYQSEKIFAEEQIKFIDLTLKEVNAFKSHYESKSLTFLKSIESALSNSKKNLTPTSEAIPKYSIQKNVKKLIDKIGDDSGSKIFI